MMNDNKAVGSIDHKKKAYVEIRVPFCKGHCVFCHDVCLGENIGYMHRYLRALEKEIEAAGEDLQGYDLQGIHLRWDGISLAGAGALDGFLSKVEESVHSLRRPLPWIVNLMPWELTDEIIYVLKERHGVDTAVLKLLALSKETLSRIRLPMTMNLAEHAVKWKKPEDLKLAVELVIGMEGQTPQMLEAWLHSCMQPAPSQICLRRFHDRHQNMQEQLLHAQETDWAGLTGAAQETLARYGFIRRGKTLDFTKPGIWIPTDLSAVTAAVPDGEKEGGANVDIFGFGLGAFNRVDGLVYHNTTDYTLYTEHPDEPDVIAVFE